MDQCLFHICYGYYSNCFLQHKEYFSNVKIYDEEKNIFVCGEIRSILALLCRGKKIIPDGAL